MFRKFCQHYLPNPFDRKLHQLRKAGGNRVLLFWNRGLGDIPLGLYAMVHRIRSLVPDAKITFLTREGLLEGFSLLEGIEVRALPNLTRGQRLASLQAFSSDFDLVIDWPDPTRWVSWQIKNLVPKLKWDPSWDILCERFSLPSNLIGVQVSLDSKHGPWRDWSVDRWQELLSLLEEKGEQVVLLGFSSNIFFPQKNLIDLRGKTSVLELLSILKNRCSKVVLPDSGILSMIYYLNVDFPIRVVSLWADKQGVLKQGVGSPNALLEHYPLFKEKKNLLKVTGREAFECLY